MPRIGQELKQLHLRCSCNRKLFKGFTKRTKTPYTAEVCKCKGVVNKKGQYFYDPRLEVHVTYTTRRGLKDETMIMSLDRVQGSTIEAFKHIKRAIQNRDYIDRMGEL